MSGLRLAIVAAVLSCPAFAEEEAVCRSPDDPKLELEVAGGASAQNDLTPTVSGRIGVDLWNWLTPSVRVLSIAPWAGPSSAWAIQGELRAHTKGTLLQLTGGVGLGLATASVERSASGIDATVARAAQPWLTGDLGARVLLGPFFVGASIGGAPLQRQWLGSLNLGVIAFGG